MIPIDLLHTKVVCHKRDQRGESSEQIMNSNVSANAVDRALIGFVPQFQVCPYMYLTEYLCNMLLFIVSHYLGMGSCSLNYGRILI